MSQDSKRSIEPKKVSYRVGLGVRLPIDIALDGHCWVGFVFTLKQKK